MRIRLDRKNIHKNQFGRRVNIEEIIECARSRSTEVAVVDVETNGLDTRNSVLSCTVIRYLIDISTTTLSKLGSLTRFYFPDEPLSRAAVRINGLTEQEITKRRRGAHYPRFFRDDSEIVSLIQHADLIVCHNADFDLGFLPMSIDKPSFCTMKSNVTKVGLRREKGMLKYPSLAETAAHYRIYFYVGSLHDSAVDAEITARILQAMIQRAVLLQKM